MTTIGKKLKYLIKEHNIKQIKLADAMGLSPSRLSNYLSDKREPDLEMLSSIANYLGVDLNYFSNVEFTVKKPVIRPVSSDQNGGIHVPFFRVNDKKRSKSHRSILLDKTLATGINNPVIIEIYNGIEGIFEPNAYAMASPLKDHEPNGTIVLETGRNFNIYRYMEYEDKRFLYNIRNKTCVNIQVNVIYYAVRWVLQRKVYCY